MSLSNIKVNNNQIISIDDEPTAESDNLVKSGGVCKDITDKIGCAYLRKGYVAQLSQQVPKWYDNGNHLFIPCKVGDVIEIKANSNEYAACAIATGPDDYNADGDIADILMSSGSAQLGVIQVQAGQVKRIKMVSPGIAMIIDGRTGPYERLPESIIINGYEYMNTIIENISDIINENNFQKNIQDQIINEVALNFESDHYWSIALKKESYPNTYCTEVTVNEGELYILNITLKGDLACGLVDNNGAIINTIHYTSETTISQSIFVPKNNCKLRISKFEDDLAKLYKVNVNLKGLEQQINDLAVFESIAGTMEDGFYNNGAVDTNYMPETYRHTLFEIPDNVIGLITRLKLSCTNTAANYDSIDLFDQEMHPLLILRYTDTGKTFSDYTIDNPNPAAKYIGINTYASASASVILVASRNQQNSASATVANSKIGIPAQIGALDYHIPDDFDYSCILIYGQSLAQGGAAQGALSLDALAGNYTLSSGIEASKVSDHSGDTLVPLKLANTSYQEVSVIGAVNTLSTLWRRYRNKECEFIGFSGGYSGAQLENIDKGSTYYNNFINACQRVKTIAQADGKTVGCPVIVFMQGESNYIPNSGTAEQNKGGYKNLIRKFKDDIQADLKGIFSQEYNPLFFVYQTGYKWIRNHHFDCSISQAQLELSQELDDVVLLNPTYQLTINTSDHPNYNGYRWYGELIAKGIWNVLYHNKRYETVRPTNFRVSGNKIIVDCYAPVFPINIDVHTQQAIQNFGFDVRINGVTAPIRSVAIEDNSIAIMLSNNISLTSDIIEISYAGLNRQGQGNICDSDTWKSLTNYEDDSDTSPYNTPNLQYPVVKRPYDVNGKPIYGKKYPMQNWLTNFYNCLSLHFVEHLVEYGVGTTFANDIVNTTNAELIYTSSDTSVAIVDSEGNVTIIEEGSCYITAKTTINNVEIKDDYLLVAK